MNGADEFGISEVEGFWDLAEFEAAGLKHSAHSSVEEVYFFGIESKHDEMPPDLGMGEIIAVNGV